MFILYAWFALRSSQLFAKLEQTASFVWPISNQQKWIMAKAIRDQTKGTALHDTAKKFYLYMLLSRYTVWIGFAVFIVTMLFFIKTHRNVDLPHFNRIFSNQL
ncbi:hypothetical protein CKK33_10180 [Mucilaginibacter sp. MD40]|nr:hypothetical protein CKK33_10180 [Mucilaginibacter sp. MD40]